MNSLQIFFKEFSNEKRRQSLIKNFVIIGFLTILFAQNKVQYELPVKSIALVILVLTFISSYTTTFNFNNINNVKRYLSLPIKKLDYIFSLYITLIVLTFVDKVLYIVALALIISPSKVNIAVVSTVSIMLMVAVSINMLVAISKKSLGLKLLNIISVIIPIALCFININQILVLIILVTILAINIFLLTTADLKNLVYYPKSKAKVRTFKNYYINVMLNDKVLIINSLFLIGLAFIYYLFLFESETLFLQALPLAFVASNKIVSTMISQDRDTLKKINSMPRNNIYKQYFIFNLILMYVLYFILFISSILVFKLNPVTMVLVLVFCPLVVASVNTYLEMHHPILIWSDLNQLWKNPRNYIVLVFAYVVILSIMLIEYI